MATALNAGQIPMNFGHSALEPIPVRNVSARVVELDEEYAVDATFDVDESAWATVEQRFDDAGVAGGFSFTAGELQIPASSGQQPMVTLAADAAAYTDDDRAEAWRLLEATGPAQVSRLYQFDAQEVLRVLVDIWVVTGPFIVNIASSGIYDALKLLLSRHRDPAVIEIHEHRADDSYSTAVIRTNDPKLLATALERLSQASDQDLKQFESKSGNWVSASPDELPPPS